MFFLLIPSPFVSIHSFRFLFHFEYLIDPFHCCYIRRRFNFCPGFIILSYRFDYISPTFIIIFYELIMVYFLLFIGIKLIAFHLVYLLIIKTWYYTLKILSIPVKFEEGQFMRKLLFIHIFSIISRFILNDRKPDEWIRSHNSPYL